MLRSKSPDMVRQEIYGYLLTHHAISTLICQAAAEADIDPDRVKFTRTLRIVRRTVAPTAFPPLTSNNIAATRSPRASPPPATSTRHDATAPIPASSNEDATTPTESTRQPTPVPATTAQPPSSSRTWERTGRSMTNPSKVALIHERHAMTTSVRLCS